jgi:hypothetical protein
MRGIGTIKSKDEGESSLGAEDPPATPCAPKPKKASVKYKGDPGTRN